MKLRSSHLPAIVAGTLCALCAGAGIAQSSIESPAPQLKTYGFGDIGESRYEVVAHLWVDSWRAAFWLPTFPTREQAIAALETEAARRGADGLLNVSCRDHGPWNWWSSAEPAFLCYGIAIRLRPGQG